MFKISYFMLCFAIVFYAKAQGVRQESTNELKKVVYIVNVAECPQIVIDDGTRPGTVNHFAVFPVPEVNVTNMPNVTLYVRGGERNKYGTYDGWYPSETWSPSDSFALGDGFIYVRWLQEVYLSSSGSEYECFPVNRITGQVKIVVVYEVGSHPLLEVSNIGTGKSLVLDWNTNVPNSKIEGYKVYRRTIAEPQP